MAAAVSKTRKPADRISRGWASAKKDAQEKESLAHFTPASLKFLAAMARNNRREWFQPRKETFLAEVRQPMLSVASAVVHAMQEFAPEHVRPPEKCLLRIYRDTRFSADKRPYKKHFAAWFGRRGLEKTSGAGFYFHVSGKELEIAAGLFVPEREQLLQIRTFLLENHQEMRRLLAVKGPKKRFVMEDGMPMTRAPKGFPTELDGAPHPALDLIRCRRWGVGAKFSPEAALGPGFAKTLIQHFRAAAPLVEFLNRPILSRQRTSRGIAGFTDF